MPPNMDKLLEILVQECKSVEERRKGYRKELMATMADILAYERQHQARGLNIKKKIADKCNALGDYLFHEES